MVKLLPAKSKNLAKGVAWLAAHSHAIFRMQPMGDPEGGTMKKVLPAAAINHMSDKAKSHVPAALLPEPPAPVNIVDVPRFDGSTVSEILATDAADYFIIDANAPFQNAKIVGFDLLNDKIVFENYTPVNQTWENLGGYNWQTTRNMDSNYGGAYINDYSGIFYLGVSPVNGGPDGGQVTLQGVHTDTALFLANNIIIAPDDWGY